MTEHPLRHDRPVFNQLHPLVYQAAIGLALWFVLSAWTLFGGGEYMVSLLGVVTVFMLIAVAIPLVMWRNGRRFTGSAAKRQGLRDWLSGDFETWQGRLSGREATIQVLLPLAAVAVGLTAIGIVLQFTAT